MAVTYANLLQKKGMQSFLCCTREEGLLKDDLNPEVGYIFLNKKSTFQLKPIFQLRSFIKKNKIEIIHAHGTSFFTATLQKFLNRDLKLVWHDHYGLSENLEQRKFFVLKKCSRKFDAVFSVNQDLKNWAEKHLRTKNVYYLTNFLPIKKNVKHQNAVLKGGNSFRIVCLANLRPQKNHLLLIRAFNTIQKEHSDVSLHLIGKNWGDAYFSKIKNLISELKLENKIFYYGSQAGVDGYLEKSDLGMLSSDSEGLPMALLEYGQAALPVVVTDVGQCREVVRNYGKIVEPKNPNALSAAVLNYIEYPKQRNKDAENFHQHIRKNYTEDAVFPQLQKLYKNL